MTEIKNDKKIDDEKIKVYQIWSFDFIHQFNTGQGKNLIYQFFSKEKADLKFQNLNENKDFMSFNWILKYELIESYVIN